MTLVRGIVVASLLASVACGGDAPGSPTTHGSGAGSGGSSTSTLSSHVFLPSSSTSASTSTGQVHVDCSGVARRLCTLGNACTTPTESLGGPCLDIFADHSSLCFVSVEACVQVFSSCESMDGGTPGVLPDPAACDEALDGLCTMEGSDTDFPLPASCVTCDPGAPSPPCALRVDAG